MDGSSSPSSSPVDQPPFLKLLRKSLTRKYDSFLDASVTFTLARWLFLSGLLLVYILRVYYLQGFYIVTYGLGIFLLNLLIGFLTPLADPDGNDGEDAGGPILPTNDGDEFKPFIPRVSEFKFWYSCARALLIGLAMTFFSLFDIPVFWPILLVYFIILFVLTMKRQIKHMIKHKYFPWSKGKKKYGSRKPTEVRSM